MIKLIVGCGYLGLRVAQLWRRDGHTVRAVTRSAQRAQVLSDQGIQPWIGDICDPSTLQDLPSADTLLFAVGYDKTSGKSQREVSVDGWKNVLQSTWGRMGRVIYVSSSSVYGQSDGDWVDEFSVTEPVQPGGQCCLAAERLLEAYARDSPLIPTNMLRLSGIYGPGRLLARTEALRAGQVMSGLGEAWLNLIHVDDAADAVLATESRGEPGQTYLVSDDRPIRRAEYYGRLASLIGAPEPRFDSNLAAVRGSGGLNKRCRNNRLRQELLVDLRYPTISEGVPQSLGALSGPSSERSSGSGIVPAPGG